MEEEKNTQRHVQWDEQKLKETEKFRGTFEKIDEPKTPYRVNSDSDQQGIQSEIKTEQEQAIEASLNKAKQNSAANTKKKANIAELNQRLKKELQQFHNGDNQMEDEDEEQQQRRKEQFKKRRAHHYDQFKLIQQMKHNKWEQESD